jgi:hypothetical protein
VLFALLLQSLVEVEVVGLGGFVRAALEVNVVLIPRGEHV